MKNLIVPIEESDYKKFGFENSTVSFDELKEKISIEYAREALIRCNEIAKETGLSELTPEEIDAEINAVRNAKNSH
jgi:hypothetical protein